jgi:hypothetical protein
VLRHGCAVQAMQGWWPDLGPCQLLGHRCHIHCLAAVGRHAGIEDHDAEAWTAGEVPGVCRLRRGDPVELPVTIGGVEHRRDPRVALAIGCSEGQPWSCSARSATATAKPAPSPSWAPATTPPAIPTLPAKPGGGHGSSWTALTRLPPTRSAPSCTSSTPPPRRPSPPGLKPPGWAEPRLPMCPCTRQTEVRPPPQASARSCSRIASTSTVTNTSSLTTMPPLSISSFQLTPKSWRLIRVVATKPARCMVPLLTPSTQ